MAEMTINNVIISGNPGIQIFKVTASTTETLSSQYGKVDACLMGYNMATGFADEKCSAIITADTHSITMDMIGSDSSDVAMTAIIFGRE